MTRRVHGVQVFRTLKSQATSAVLKHAPGALFDLGLTFSTPVDACSRQRLPKHIAPRAFEGTPSCRCSQAWKSCAAPARTPP